jgi:hypothetical protein
VELIHEWVGRVRSLTYASTIVTTLLKPYLEDGTYNSSTSARAPGSIPYITTPNLYIIRLLLSLDFHSRTVLGTAILLFRLVLP